MPTDAKFEYDLLFAQVAADCQVFQGNDLIDGEILALRYGYHDIESSEVACYYWTLISSGAVRATADAIPTLQSIILNVWHNELPEPDAVIGIM